MAVTGMRDGELYVWRGAQVPFDYPCQSARATLLLSAPVGR